MSTLKECLYDTIHRNDKPAKAIAEEIGMSYSYLARAVLADQEESETGTGCRFPLSKLIPIIRATKDFSTLDYIEASLGRVAIPLPAANKSLPDICRLTMQTIKEFGELMAEIDQSMADGRVSAKEKERIVREGHDALQGIMNLVKTIESQP
jgi:hypothetical protein